jgi:hypothetical protein
LYLDPLERSKAGINDHQQPLVAFGGVFQADGKVVGLYNLFTVALGLIANRNPIDADPTGSGHF